MDPVSCIRKLFQYDHWGNHESLNALSSASSESALKIFAHIVGAQRVWLSRLEPQAGSAPEPWPSLSLEDCKAAVENLHERWTAFLGSLSLEQLGKNVSYRNSKGTEFKTPLEDVLQHVVIHSAYHRGQVATSIRQAGGKPAATDYVVYVRQTP